MTSDETRATFWQEGIELFGKQRKAFLGLLLKCARNDYGKALEAVRVAAAGRASGMFAQSDVEGIAKRFAGDKPKPPDLNPQSCSRLAWASAVLIFRLGYMKCWDHRLGPPPDHPRCLAPKDLLTMPRPELKAELAQLQARAAGRLL